MSHIIHQALRAEAGRVVQLVDRLGVDSLPRGPAGWPGRLCRPQKFPHQPYKLVGLLDLRVMPTLLKGDQA